ncbi:hypothetical protein [Halosegnis longus]|uniref:Uncharacterized protein n=1 Tax=Halosegnis longus TaxID=2216012 RepID=A0AAJ4UWN1_9EURY|nr:hypothetical protein Nmn1133_10590 [Salella cibi]
MSATTPRRLVATLAVVALLVLAGCSGLTGSFTTATPSPSPTATTTPTATGTPTVTSTPTPTATPTATPDPADADQLAPGITAAGVVNASAAAAAHDARAAATPGVSTLATNISLDGQRLVTHERAVATANLTRVDFVARYTTVEGTETTELVSANATTVRNFVRTNETVRLDSYQNRTETFDTVVRSLATDARVIEQLLTRGNFTAESVTVDGEPMVRLTTETYAGSQYDADTVESYEARVLVSPDGLVHSARERLVLTDAVPLDAQQRTYQFTPRTVDLPPTLQLPSDLRADTDATS